nr:alpha-2-macroglobulin [Acidobacteriota bacterium]
GGDDGGELRSRFKTTVLFAPEVVTGADGRARVSFELPDNLTTYRVMALAIGEDERFGTGRGSLTVSKPLLAIPALPRVARVGDRFEAGVVVHAKDPAALGGAAVEVTAEAAGGVALSGPATKSVRLPDGRAQEVRFAFTGSRPEPATLRFTIRAAGERDAVEQALVVAPSAAPEVVATYGDTESERTEAIVVPQGVRPDAGGLELTLASTALAGFDGAMRQLVDYPYGCAEQIASRLVPFVALRQIQKAYGLAPTGAEERERQRARESQWLSAWLEPGGNLSGAAPQARPSDPDAIVAEAIATLAALQRDDGGFRYWPSTAEASPWASAWAVLALARARDAGYAVEPSVIANGQRYLAETIAAGGPVRALYTTFTPTPDDRAFALWVLARSGAPKGSYYADLFEQRSRLTLASRAMLADAMLQPGATAADAARGQELLTALVDAARITAGEAFFQDSDRASFAAAWSSDVTTTAIVLLLLEARAPEHPLAPMLARWLAGQRQPNGGYRTTQESGWTLLALADLAATRERTVPDFAARVALGGAELATAEFRGRSLELTRRAVPMPELARAGRSAPLVFSRQGSGTLYYGARLTYLPERPPTAALDRGLIVQRWLSPFGATGQARSFGAGALVTLTVRVATPQERRFVAVDVPVPAGFEAVDASLATASRSARLPAPGWEDEAPLLEEGLDGGLPAWAYGDYTPFARRELRDDRVLAFADQLPPGVWEARFVLRATTPGTFLFPPATASEMYRPETFGRDGALEVTVTP